ncbi:hypothetical protein COW38_04435, partial [Candidatus Collierbacteria bacterium CG17_big_fil_post_rev_8_21_14_2_50_45_7]|uniref:Uncharacterized protein n=2 Tax=Microgenomates group TaxID=1794810 RepID=A0A2M8L1K4_9BACT
MAIIGVDVSKLSLVAVRTSSTGIVKESFEIQNTEVEIGTWLDKLQSKHKYLLVASEATAEYHNILAKACLAKAIKFRLLNPILTKQFNRATIRKRKTDLTDALIIAKLAIQGEGSIVTPASLSPAKVVHRTAIRLVKVEQTLESMCRRFSESLPEEKAVNQQLLDCMQLLKTSCEVLRSRARESTDPKLTKLLMSIPGVGERIVVTLINEIENIHRFPSPKSLVAYAGLDPRVRQSGTSLKRNTHVTKRGSIYLRRDLYIAATIAARWDSEVHEYCEKKLGEGKRYREAMMACSRKLLNRVYAVWKRGTPYERRLATTGT